MRRRWRTPRIETTGNCELVRDCYCPASNRLALRDDLGDTRDPDLIVMIIEIAQFDLGVRGDLDGLVVRLQIGDEDREAVGANGRHGTQPRLVAINRGKMRKAIRTDDLSRQFGQLCDVDRCGSGTSHRKLLRDFVRSVGGWQCSAFADSRRAVVRLLNPPCTTNNSFLRAAQRFSGNGEDPSP